MKYLRVLKEYLFVFVGAVFFGLAAAKYKSARRTESKANDKLRDLQEEQISDYDKKIEGHINNVKKAEERATKRKENALKRLDTISNNSSSVGGLLDEYNRKRV
ncbi:MAG: hypothetical protein QNJ81_02595 [Acidimicrobiia bacterium]|nr:hypothetical protein [Acidimicrobiia bacterium]